MTIIIERLYLTGADNPWTQGDPDGPKQIGKALLHGQSFLHPDNPGQVAIVHPQDGLVDAVHRIAYSHIGMKNGQRLNAAPAANVCRDRAIPAKEAKKP